MYNDERYPENESLNKQDCILEDILEQNNIRRPELRRNMPIAPRASQTPPCAERRLRSDIQVGCGCEGSRAMQREGQACVKDSSNGITCRPVGMAYAPIQVWEGLYNIESALEKGTLFKALDLPFYAGGCKKGGVSYE